MAGFVRFTSRCDCSPVYRSSLRKILLHRPKVAWPQKFCGTLRIVFFGDRSWQTLKQRGALRLVKRA